MRFFFAAIILGCVICSCSLVKRRYSSGFYTANIHHISHPQTSRQNPPDINMASASREKSMILKPLTMVDSGKCDTIILNTGFSLAVRVIEAKEMFVKYRDCNDPNGVVSEVRRRDIAYVKFAKGYTIQYKPNRTVRSDAPERLHGTISLLAGIGGLGLIPATIVPPTSLVYGGIVLVLALFSIILGIITILRKGKGQFMAFIGMSLAVLAILILLIFLL